MTVKSLMELATMACIKNIKSLESLGDYMPYESMRHILLKVDSAWQLRQIEINSPQIQGETSELWIRLIERDFPLEYKANAYKPSSPDKWHRVWEKYKKEHVTALEESERKLMNALAGLKESKEKNTSKIVERKFLPRAGRVGPKRVWGGPRDHTSSTLTFTSGSRTKTHTGASVMRKVRREVKEIANIHGSLSKVIRAPTRHGELKKAPAAMVGDYQRAAQPEFRGAAKAPEPLSIVEQYEQRATVISDSEEEDDEDDFFGEADRKATVRSSPPPGRHVVSEAAKVSLLKKKPATLGAQPPVKAQHTSAQKQLGSGEAVHGPNRGAATIANKFRRAPAKPRAVCALPADESPSPPPTAPVDEASETETGRARSRLSPARETSAGPSSPKNTEASLQPIQRKRKAVDIFMRRKKRAG